MSHLITTFGRGLLGKLSNAFTFMHQDEPSSDDQRVHWAAKALDDGNEIYARDVFKELVLDFPVDREAHIGLACSAYQIGDIETAIDHFQIAHRIEPDDSAVLFCLGFCHEVMGDYLRATRYYNDSLKICPTLRNSRERLAAIHLNQGNQGEAIKQYKALCWLDPDTPRLEMTLAELLLQNKEYERARVRFQQVLYNLQPDDNFQSGHHYERAMRSGDYREAIKRLLECLPDHDESHQIHHALARLYRKTGDDTLAITHYEKACALNPNDSSLLCEFGGTLQSESKYSEAASRYCQAIDLMEIEVAARVGEYLAQRGKTKSPESDARFKGKRPQLERVNELVKVMEGLFVTAAIAQYSANQRAPTEFSSPLDMTGPRLNAQLLKDFKSQTVQYPNCCHSHYSVGMLLKRSGDVSGALASFKRSVEINPCFSQAQLLLGFCFVELGEWQRAFSALRKAKDIKPGYRQVMYRFDQLFVQKHQFELAVESFGSAHGSDACFERNMSTMLQSSGLIVRSDGLCRHIREAIKAGEFARMTGLYTQN